MRNYLTVGLTSTILLACGSAWAATPLSAGPKPPSAPAQERFTASQGAVAEARASSIPPAVLEQAAAQRNGEFGPMARPTAVGGQIQKAWDEAGREAGVHTQVACGDCVYKVRTREYMVTAIVLPNDLVIASADLGDTDRFSIAKRNEHTLVVEPKGAGVDTSLLVYTEDGQVFSFYLRAETFNSKHVPDLTFRIAPRPTYASAYLNFDGSGAAVDPATGAPLPLTNSNAAPEQGAKDFVRAVGFDPSKLRMDGFKLYGDKSLRPKRVFRDDHFTYIDYGDKWSSLELPTAYVVIDKIDELVNTRVQGHTLVVESVNPLITLKSGDKYLCIKYKGK